MADHLPEGLSKILARRPDLEHPARTRDHLGYYREFDVVLVGACELGVDCDEEAYKGLVEYYEDIGSRIQNLRKTIFLPHRDLDDSMGMYMGDVYALVVSTAHLVLAYMGVESDPTGFMLARAATFQKPLIMFHEEGQEQDPRATPAAMVRHAKSVIPSSGYSITEIVGKTRAENARLVEEAARQFFQSARYEPKGSNYS